MVQVVRIDGPALVGPGEPVQLVLVQPPEPDVSSVERDAPGREALGMLRGVLDPTGGVLPVLEDGPVVVLVPELAFASGALDEVRTLLLRSDRRVILVAGFGLTPRAVLADWHARGKDRAVEVVSPLDQGPLRSPTARINGAWVLVNEPGVGVRGWAHVKTFPEQRFEKSTFRSARGSTVPRIRLGPGLTVVPLICAELLQDAASGQEPDEFAARAVVADLLADRADRVLVATSSWQSDPAHPSWAAGLDGLFADPRLRPALRVAIANHALDPDDNLRRSLCGVVADVDDLRAPADRPFVLARAEGRWAAQLLRFSLPGVAAGGLRWGGNTGDAGRDAWDVTLAWRWASGALHPRDPVDAHAVELGRALARARPSANPTERSRREALADEARHARGALGSLWAYTARDGLDRPLGDLDPDQLAPTLGDDAALVQAAAVTSLLPRVDGPGEDHPLPVDAAGSLVARRVLRLEGRDEVALVWHSDRWSARQQYARLVEVVGRLRHAPPLVVVGGSTLRGSTPRTGPVGAAASQGAPATGPVAEGSLVHAGHDSPTLTLPDPAVAGWLSADELADAVADAPDEAALVSAVQALLDRASPPDRTPGGSP